LGRIYRFRSRLDDWFRGCFGLRFPDFFGCFRNEANFFQAACFVELLELVEAAIEGALGLGSVAEHEGDLFGVAGIGFFREEGSSAEADPVLLDHFGEDDLLGCGGGLPFRDEVVDERIEFFFVLRSGEEDFCLESMTEGIFARGDFAFWSLGSC
jgi:hypothetical protein